jgi:serine/threonine-protein kinase
LGGWQLARCQGGGRYTEVYRATAVDCTDAGDGTRAASEQNKRGTRTPDSTDPASRSHGTHAVKVIRRDFEDDPDVLHRLAHEAAAAQAATSRHLITVLQASLHQPPFFLVMPWLEGTTLFHLLAQSGPLPEALALWYTRQAAEALQALHAAGWIHGDVKPENVMVSPTGHATLLDLGFARTTGEWDSNQPFAGTPAYTPPERFLARGRAAPAGDLYSLGAMLYELLTGERPAGNGGNEPPTGRVRVEPRSIRRRCPTLAPETAWLVHRLLAHEPIRRPATAAEVVNACCRLEIRSFAVRGLPAAG